MDGFRKLTEEPGNERKKPIIKGRTVLGRTVQVRAVL